MAILRFNNQIRLNGEDALEFLAMTGATQLPKSVLDYNQRYDRLFEQWRVEDTPESRLLIAIYEDKILPLAD